MRAHLFLAVWFFAASSFADQKGSLTPATMTSWKIVRDSAASECEQYAASEFQQLFAAMTGATLPIVDTPPTGSGSIRIGAAAHLDNPTKPANIGEEGFHIEITENSLAISGGRPRGTLYGVYDFFEEQCGVRFLTYDCTHYPKNILRRKIPFGSYQFNPTFAFRWSYYGENHKYPEFAARLHVNTVSDDPRLGGRTGYRLVSHNVAYLVPPAKYGKDHPEYYALVAGQRKLEMGGGGPQLCVSNPDVIDRVTEAVLEEIKKNPAARNINIAQMDNESYCTCTNCAAIDAREESHAGAHLALVNAVAERVEKTHPDVFISCYAYQYTRKPPKNLSPRHNVLIQLCSIECCDLHPIDDPDCPLNRAFCEDMAGWKKKAETIFIWHYNTNFRGYMLPFPNLRSIGRSVTYFAVNNGKGVFMQAAGNGFSTELSDLRNYVMARCLWKPGRDSWQEAEEFCRLYYQEAAPPILDYLKYYHQLVSRAGVHPTCFPTDASLRLNPETTQHIMDYFQRARSLARSDIIRARVEKASLCADRAALSVSSMRLAYTNGLCRADLRGFSPDLLEHYVANCQRFGVSMDDEHVSNDQFLGGIRRLYAGLKAVQIENEFWRVVILPENNAKVVEMTYKPTGRNVVAARRAFNRFRYEEWVRSGEGPTAANVIEYQVSSNSAPDRVTLAAVTKDGAHLDRSITLNGDAVRFETALTAASARSFDFLVHPEYDTATGSDDAAVLAIYVKNPDWIYANRLWKKAIATDAQRALIHDAAAGGAFAYYNHQARFGVEQRFDSKPFSNLGIFWSPSREQINLELSPRVISLEPGQQAGYAYEVRYLKNPPIDVR